MRRAFALKAFRHTAQYDATVAGYLGAEEALPDSLTLTFEKIDDMRYGETLTSEQGFIVKLVERAVLPTRLARLPAMSTARQGAVVQQHQTPTRL